jgi:glycosidase
VREAAKLLLTLPGTAFVYQGDELGLPNGPGREPPHDRAGRDAMRHPMQWDASPAGGFTTGDPWLAPIDPAERNVADQLGDPASLLHEFRRLIEYRRGLGEEFRLLGDAPDVVEYARDGETIAVSTRRRAR